MIGGGAGHIADMIARIRYNESLRQKNKKGYGWAMHNFIKVAGPRDKINPADQNHDFKIIRIQIKKLRRQETIKDIIALGISLLLTAAILYTAYYFLW